MLRVSKLADYATVVMVCLARHSDEVLNAKQLAQLAHLGVPTVSKLLKLLANANLLQSQRGASGGYSLSRSAEKISVAEIIRAVEGDTGLTQCSQHEGECSIEAVCAIRSNWRVLSHAIYTALDSVSLENLARPKLSVTKIDVSEITGLSEQADKREE